MRRLLSIFSVLLFALVLSGANSASTDLSPRVTPALEQALTAAGADGEVRAWIFFSDKGPNPAKQLQAAEQSLTDRARRRRERNRAQSLVDTKDIPVVDSYVRGVARGGAHLRHTSRWLNAVSVTAHSGDLKRISRLPYVKRVDVVRSYRAALPETRPLEKLPGGSSGPARSSAGYDYGASLPQIQQINVIPLHNLGYTGAGMTIAVLDAGFNNLGHESMTHLDILDTWDFVNGDSNVDDEVGQMGSGSHGTLVLSALAGLAPGHLIGPAYSATFLLYKTENTVWERHIEEDDWVAGAERADSVGADIISTSLGYSTGFTNGEASYTWMDMDGNTTIATIGADIAASKGILVFASAGNSGPALPGQNTLIGPSDGDSVIAVGAVDSTGVRASFSSVGKSYDGRIKPDVMAMGVATVCAVPTDLTSYTTATGTSLSCPLASGAAALVWQANPTLTNMEIRDLLRATASNALAPDSLFGWGIIDAWAAATALSPFTATPAPSSIAAAEIFPPVPNPFNPVTTISYRLDQSGAVRLSVYDIRGALVTTLVDEAITAGVHRVVWNGTDSHHAPVASGVYFFRLRAGMTDLSTRAVLLK